MEIIVSYTTKLKRLVKRPVVIFLLTIVYLYLLSQLVSLNSVKLPGSTGFKYFVMPRHMTFPFCLLILIKSDILILPFTAQ